MSKLNLTQKNRRILRGSVCLAVIVSLSACARMPKPDLTTTAAINQNIETQKRNIDASVTVSDGQIIDPVRQGDQAQQSQALPTQNNEELQIIRDENSSATLLMGAPRLADNVIDNTAGSKAKSEAQAKNLEAPRSIAELQVKSVSEPIAQAEEIAEETAKKPTLFSWIKKKRKAKADRAIRQRTQNTVNIAAKSTRKTKIKAEQKKPTLFGMFKKKNIESLPSNIDPMETASIEATNEMAKVESKSIDLNADDAPLDKADKGTLTLYSVVKKTLETNPEVGIAYARERDASEAVSIANADYYPSVDVEMSTGLENSFVETQQELAVNRTDANLQLNQKVFDFGITKSKIERQEKLLESARLRRIDKSEQIAFNVVEAYLEVLKQTDLAETAKRNVKAHEKMAKLVEISEKEGNASLADVKRVQTRLDSAKSVVLDIENKLKGSIGAFKRITGIDPNKLKRPKTITAKLGKVSKSEIPSVALANFELRALASDRDSLDMQLKQQFGQRYPEFFVSAQANYKNNNAGETGRSVDMRGMLGMRYRLFDGGKRRATERQIDARSLEAELNYEKTYRELIKQLDDNAQAIESSEEKSAFLADSVEAARKVVSLYTEQFKLAEKSPFELLDAQQDLYNAERELITNKFDAANATFNNLKLRGTLIHYLLK